jgi:excisionase family DNA binding protein
MPTMQPLADSTGTASTYYFEPLLTDEQAGQLLGLHPKTLQRLARTGQITAHRIGRFWRYRASELDRWLAGTLSCASQSARVNEEN